MGEKMSRSRVGFAAVAVAAVLAALWFFGLRKPEGETHAKGAAAQAGRSSKGGGGGGEASGGSAPRGTPGVAWDRDPEGPLRLEGQVVDQHGDPVADALVMLATTPMQTTKSQTDGSFAFDKLISRTFYVNARAGNLVGGATYKLTSTSDPVVVRLRLGTTVAVKVQDEAAQPVRGARIRVDAGDEPEASDWIATSDEAGAAIVQGLPLGWGALIAEAEGFAPGRGQTMIGEPNPDPKVPSTELTIVMRKGVAVSGRVVDEAGKPISNVRVRPELSRAWSDPNALQAVVSDAQGAFTFAALPAGNYVFSAKDGEHGHGTSAATEVAAQPVQGVTITLPPGGELAGAVVDKQGAEVPFAVVRVTVRADDPEREFEAYRHARQVASDAHGRFAIKGLMRTKLQLRAEGERAASPITDVSLEETLRRDDVRLVLELDGLISGTVVDEAGEPVAEVQVSAFVDVAGGASRESYALSRNPSTTSDGSGGFTLTGLTSSAYRIWAGQGGNSFDAEVPSFKVGERNARIVLSKPGRIVGKVIGSDGKPPATATIDTTGQVPVTTRDGAFIVNEVMPGSYDVQVRSPEHTMSTREAVKVVAGKDTDLGTITLASGRRITGRVLDAQKRPVAGARVRASEHLFNLEEDDASGFINYGNSGMQGPSTTTTDAKGAFELRGLPASNLQVAAFNASGRSEVVNLPEGEADPAPVTLRLRGLGSVAGTVTVGGKPANGFVVVLSAKDGAGVPSFGKTAPDGTYLLERIPEGAHEVSAAPSGGGGGRGNEKPVTVVAGQRAKIDFALAGGGVTLTTPISALPNQRVDAAQVFLYEGAVTLATGAELHSRREGGAGMAFWFGGGSPMPRFRDLRPGNYSVCALPITGDMRGSKLLDRVMRNAEKMAVTCKPVTVTAAPAEQSFALVLPAMTPLPAEDPPASNEPPKPPAPK